MNSKSNKKRLASAALSGSRQTDAVTILPGFVIQI
jgi:hypothetical protein